MQVCKHTRSNGKFVNIPAPCDPPGSSPCTRRATPTGKMLPNTALATTAVSTLLPRHRDADALIILWKRLFWLFCWLPLACTQLRLTRVSMAGKDQFACLSFVPLAFHCCISLIVAVIFFIFFICFHLSVSSNHALERHKGGNKLMTIRTEIQHAVGNWLTSD